jgi:hypothetical protein
MVTRTIGLCLIGLAYIVSAQAQTGARKALVIGNGQYKLDEKSSGFDNIPSAPMDANKIGAKLEENGFDPANVTIKTNLDFKAMIIALSDFAQSLTGSDSAVVYYSGHGFALDGEDYIAPKGFQFGPDKDSTKKAAVSLQQVLNGIHRARLSAVILDACRDEPPSIKSPKATQNSFEHLVPPSGSGSIVAFATDYGYTTSGTSASGLSFYTQYLVESLESHPPTLDVALERAKDLLLRAHPHNPPPGIYLGLNGHFPLSGRSPALADENTTSSVNLNRPRLVEEVGIVYKATWEKELFFQAWANPFTPQSATVEHGILTVVSPSGRKVVESFNPQLLPKPLTFNTTSSSQLGLNAEELMKASKFYSSYAEFQGRLFDIASDGTNLPYKLAKAGAAANLTILRARDFYCTLHIQPPKVLETHPIPWTCDSVKQLAKMAQ